MSQRADSQAFHEFLQVLQNAEQEFLTARNQTTDGDIADCYKHLLDTVAMGVDFYVDNDWERPHFVRIVSPFRKLGGDNAHAFYEFAPIRGDLSYRIRGNRGSTVYMGLTVYGGAAEDDVDVVANTNCSEFSVDANGDFEIVLSADPTVANGADHIALRPDANTLIVRHYFLDGNRENPATLSIQPLDNPGKPPRLGQASMAQRLRSLTAVVRGWARLSPLAWPDEPEAYNSVTPPFQTTASTGHWATPDNVHAFGFYRLADDEALVLHGRSPESLYWSCHLWNACMQTFDYDNYRCAIAAREVQLEADGSWKLAIAGRDPGLPNWLDTAGHEHGFIYFRWLLSSDIPPPIQATVVQLPTSDS